MKRLSATALALMICFIGLTATGQEGAEPELTRITRDGREFDKLAKKAYKQLLEVFQEELGSPYFTPKLVKFTAEIHKLRTRSYFHKNPHDLVWFAITQNVHHGQARIYYQNPYHLTKSAFEINRKVIRGSNDDEVYTYCEFTLYWFLAHELVHAARFYTKNAVIMTWEEEYVANTVQPYFTKLTLEENPDAPYRPEQAVAVYDRFVEVLRPEVDRKLIEAVEVFITTEGRTPPAAQEPWELFLSDLVSFVYISARVTQASAHSAHTIEQLIATYLYR